LEARPLAQGRVWRHRPADDSGSLQYVRIEYPGIAFQANNEINGLTMAGVGYGTRVNHIQVSNSGDDSFEWFGGTVNAKYLVAQSGTDDDFDTDNGYSGRVQFALALRDPSRGDIASGGVSNGLESDNDANGSATSLLTSSVFSNFTILLPPSTTPPPPTITAQACSSVATLPRACSTPSWPGVASGSS
jgi:hypothetical protein